MPLVLPGVVTCLHEVEATTPDRTSGPGRPLRILVADDSCDGAESLALPLTLDGHEVARAVRDEPWRRSMLLVALTGWGQEDDKRRAADAGFDVHLTKPIAPELLGAVIRPPGELRLA